MKNKGAIWLVSAVIAFIVLALIAPPFARPPKAQAQRITTVNTVRSVSLILTNTNALSSAQPGVGK